jgi:hypothetical protein
MGLTIHYEFRLSGSESDARQFIHGLHQAAQDLPFASVEKVVEVKVAPSDPGPYNPHEARSERLWSGYRQIEYDRERTGPNSYRSRRADVAPTHLIEFMAQPGEGCETATVGLCRYPTFVQVSPSRQLRTRLDGCWRWSCHCKTQYASNPKYGGVENFLCCHLSVVALLDQVKTSACRLKVYDEGEFWQKRSVPELVREVGVWNEDMAGFFSAFQSVIGPGLQGSIRDFPNFEHLEAAGLSKPKLAKLHRLFASVGAKLDLPGGPKHPSASKRRE